MPWQRIRQDYFAVHERHDTRLEAYFAEKYPDDAPLSAADRARHQRVLERGAVLVRRVLELMMAEPIAAVREAAVRYLLNRDFSVPEAMARESEAEQLWSVDEERKELRT